MHCWNFLMIYTGTIACICIYMHIHINYACSLCTCGLMQYTCRSMPVETLHTILLGPYKYLLRSLMGRLMTAQKEELQARLLSFDFSGLDYKLSYNLIRHFRSFVGRDFKAVAQIALFLLGPFMTPEEKKVWLSLSKVSWQNHVHCVCK